MDVSVTVMKRLSRNEWKRWCFTRPGREPWEGKRNSAVIADNQFSGVGYEPHAQFQWYKKKTLPQQLR